jgi:hypothetical protein
MLMTFAVTLSPMRCSTSFGLLHPFVGKLAHVNQAFDAVLQPCERAKADELGNLDFDMGADG